MRIETQYESGVVLYRISGDLKFSNWAYVISELEKIYGQGERNIVLNWKAVDNFDTSGLQTLVALFKIGQKDPDFRFALVTDKPSHIKVLKVCGFDKFVGIFPSEDEAIKHCLKNSDKSSEDPPPLEK